MGFSHYANVGCIRSHQEGILTAVEVMVPCDYFPEAVQLLQQNPGLDVGIHLTLNSEWENIKWGPLTDVPSLVDEKGYFFPMIWPDGAYGSDRALGTASWKLDEIEKELRAQIETILLHLPHCSHATPHMGFHTISSDIYHLVLGLVREYNIDDNIRWFPLESISLFGDAFTVDEMVVNAVQVLETLGPGTYEFIDHPGGLIQGEEMAWHIGAENDALYRDAVTRALIHRSLRDVVRRRGIELIGYRDI
jgi:predicted glycoside hydrolase/deacetylase ChbG (UPF0249 family)